LTTVTGYRLTSYTGSSGPSNGDVISVGASTAGINTNSLTPSRRVTVNYPGNGPVA
jgi:hypothetical protein